jgi:hypothetical protein
MQLTSHSVIAQLIEFTLLTDDDDDMTMNKKEKKEK